MHFDIEVFFHLNVQLHITLRDSTKVSHHFAATLAQHEGKRRSAADGASAGRQAGQTCGRQQKTVIGKYSSYTFSRRLADNAD